MTSTQLIQNLSIRGENILKENLQDEKEEVLIKLKGTFGEGLVVTDKKIYVLKWGFMAGNIIGGRCNAFEYGNITGVEIKKNLITGTFEVLTPSNYNSQKSYWGTGKNNATRSDNVITFQRQSFDAFQEATRLTRNLINKFHTKDDQGHSDLSELEKLAELRDKGIITQEEFDAKKKLILGL